MKVDMFDIGEQYQVDGEDEAVSFTHIWFGCSVYSFNMISIYLEIQSHHPKSRNELFGR